MNDSDNLAKGNPRAGWLWFSLALNAGLASAAAILLLRPAPNFSAAPAARVVAVSETTRQITNVNVVAPPVLLTNQFHWSQLESTNYEEYVANLRATGCP